MKAACVPNNGKTNAIYETTTYYQRRNATEDAPWIDPFSMKLCVLVSFNIIKLLSDVGT